MFLTTDGHWQSKQKNMDKTNNYCYGTINLDLREFVTSKRMYHCITKVTIYLDGY